MSHAPPIGKRILAVFSLTYEISAVFWDKVLGLRVLEIWDNTSVYGREKIRVVGASDIPIGLCYLSYY